MLLVAQQRQSLKLTAVIASGKPGAWDERNKHPHAAAGAQLEAAAATKHQIQPMWQLQHDATSLLCLPAGGLQPAIVASAAQVAALPDGPFVAPPATKHTLFLSMTRTSQNYEQGRRSKWRPETTLHVESQHGACCSSSVILLSNVASL
jgi:hypothetical protein